MIGNKTIFARFILMFASVALGCALLLASFAARTAHGSPAMTAAPILMQQGGFGASTFPPECLATVNITGVKLLGNSNGKDHIQIDWTVTGPQSPCVSLVDFRVDVKVTRKHGNVDTGNKSTNSGTARSAIVDVPRAALETDPVSFDVSVSGRYSAATLDRTVRTQGSGVPAVNTASRPGLSGAKGCDPTVSFADFNFFPKGAGGKDVVGVFWNATPPSPCLKFSKFTVTVKLTRTDGSVTTGSSPVSGDLRSARVEVPGAGFDILSFEINLTATSVSTVSSILASANKKGNF